MHHYEQKKPKKEQIGTNEIGTFSQCGEFYNRAKFTAKKCLPKNRRK